MTKVNSQFLLPAILDLRSKSEVGDLDLHCVADEHVSELQIAMHNPFAMDILAALHQLTKKEPNFGLGQSCACL